MYLIVILFILILLMIGLACITNFKLKKIEENATHVLNKANHLFKLMDYTEDDLIELRLKLGELSDALYTMADEVEDENVDDEDVDDE